MVIWTIPIVLSSCATTASGMECQASAAPEVAIGGSIEQATGPVEFTNSRSELNLPHGWCEVNAAVGRRRTSVILSGAARIEWL
jgi:hypothetical protein